MITYDELKVKNFSRKIIYINVRQYKTRKNGCFCPHYSSILQEFDDSDQKNGNASDVI